MHWLKKKRFWLVMLGFVLFIGVCSFPYRRAIKEEVKELILPPPSGEYAECKGCNRYFPDGVVVHELAYFNEGIEPQKTNRGLVELLRKRVLVEIEPNSMYLLDELTHSMPLVLPKVVSFLDDLSKAYLQKCTDKSIPYYPFTISSVTRSEQSVKKLQGGNVNAISNSAHLKGKTIDISYQKFDGYAKQLELFIQTLREFRKNDRCYVKFERKQRCLHITIR
jgi:hypothetical protein